MNGIVVSVTSNLLKVTISTETGVKSESRELDAAIVSGSTIINTELFTDKLQNLLLELVGNKYKSFPIHFVVEPSDVYLNFITIQKSDQSQEEFIQEQIVNKLNGVPLEELFYSYQKIAPFVYQFIAVKSERVNKYLEISTRLGLNLMSVLPWNALLPKFLPDNEPAIFISRAGEKQIIVLSELNGIYFSGVYDRDKTTEELKELVQSLSVYKRVEPIKRVYTLNCDNFQMDASYQVYPLPLPVENLTVQDDYKVHTLVLSVLDAHKELLETQNNLLNLLPLPVVKKTSSVTTYVVASILTLILLGGLGAYLYMNNKSSVSTGDVAGENKVEDKQNEQAPSSNNDANGSIGISSTEPNSTFTAPTQPDDVTSETVDTTNLNKADLRIRVENAAGVAGVAGTAQTNLESLGYTVDSIGNAEGAVRTNTLVNFKASKNNYRNLLIEDIKDDYEIIFEDNLPEPTEYDVLIIIGSN